MRRKSRFLVISAASALFLAGCEGAGERQQRGAILGGMFGGVLGAASDDEDGARNAALGTAAGAMAGGMIGAMLDEQAEDLRSSLENDGIIVENTGEFLRVTMPGGLLFDSDSVAVQPSVQADLRALARNLIEYSDSTVGVFGHTDNTGSPEYNQGLSERRAQAVRAILVQQGVAPVRVRAIGLGETQPLASNSTPEGRQQNRRVEIIIRPNA
ncbi:OmpA family protein [Rhodosalinus sp. FB01]|uniref:OmpA family protein n=1 Tax=Rhodosalinus sp. FB01 TaxID=3239194 RepID=UPI0035262326